MLDEFDVTAEGGRQWDDSTSSAPKDRRVMVTRLAQIASVAGPVAVFLALGGGISSGSHLLWGVAISAIFLVSLQSSYAVTEKELYTLGSALGAAQGVIVGFVAVSALDLWSGGLALSTAGLGLCSLAIFALSSLHRSRLRKQTRRVLILGAGTMVRDLIDAIHTAPEPFVPIGIVDDDVSLEDCGGVPVLGRLDDLTRIIEDKRPDLVVMGLERNRPAMFRHLLERASLGFRVVEVAQFYEHAFGRVPIRDLTRAWFMSVLHLYQRPYSRAVNRTFDITLAMLGLVLALPIALALSVLIRTTRGPVILRQTRLGENGRPFTMYKFRTMRYDAEDGLAVWAIHGDARITSLGRFMRRFRLDEIPQLWNVLRGEMSIVGPRPERPEFMAELQEGVPFWDRRTLIKPGITGWAQIRRGYTSDADSSLDKLSYDLWYLRHRNLIVDVAICIQTIAFLLRGDPTRSPTRALDGSELEGTVAPGRVLTLAPLAEAQPQNGAAAASAVARGDREAGSDTALDLSLGEI